MTLMHTHTVSPRTSNMRRPGDGLVARPRYDQERACKQRDYDESSHGAPQVGICGPALSEPAAKCDTRFGRSREG